MSHLNYGFIDGRISEEKFIDKIIKLRSRRNGRKRIDTAVWRTEGSNKMGR
jgi:hypothetical protein